MLRNIFGKLFDYFFLHNHLDLVQDRFYLVHDSLDLTIFLYDHLDLVIFLYDCLDLTAKSK